MLTVEGFSVANRAPPLLLLPSATYSRSILLQQQQQQQEKQEYRSGSFLFSSTSSSDNEKTNGGDGVVGGGDDDNDKPKKKKKKKKKTQLIILNSNLTNNQQEQQQRPKSMKLGVPSKGSGTRKIKEKGNNNKKRLSMKAQKIKNQRTSGGKIDSSSSSTKSTVVGKGNEESNPNTTIQIVIGKRGSKKVTMIQGMTSTSMEERKKLLKILKSKVGGGGTLVDGVLELQGSHSDTVFQFLLSKGYTNIRK